jgi:hypothetical protein
MTWNNAYSIEVLPVRALTSGVASIPFSIGDVVDGALVGCTSSITAGNQGELAGDLLPSLTQDPLELIIESNTAASLTAQAPKSTMTGGIGAALGMFYGRGTDVQQTTLPSVSAPFELHATTQLGYRPPLHGVASLPALLTAQLRQRFALLQLHMPVSNTLSVAQIATAESDAAILRGQVAAAKRTIRSLSGDEFHQILALLSERPVEDGIIHPAESRIALLVGAQGEQFVYDKLFTCATAATASIAAFIRLLGRVENLSADFHLQLVTAGLASADHEVRDAALQAAESWEDRDILPRLREHHEPLPWLADYLKRLVRDLGG